MAPVLLNPSRFGGGGGGGGLVWNEAQVLADSPWGYWRTNEASGTLTDSSGNGRTMTIPGGSPVYAQPGLDGLTADALSWPDSSGATDYYARTSATVGVTVTQATLECLFYIAALPTNPTELVGLSYGYGGNSHRPMHLYLTSTGLIRLWWGNNSNQTGHIASAGPVSLNTWHHGVGKVSGSTGTIRVDKVDVVSAAGSTMEAHTSAFGIMHGGENNLANLTNSSAVLISKPAIYLTALSNARIDAHVTP